MMGHRCKVGTDFSSVLDLWQMIPLCNFPAFRAMPLCKYSMQCDDKRPVKDTNFNILTGTCTVSHLYSGGHNDHHIHNCLALQR